MTLRYKLVGALCGVAVVGAFYLPIQQAAAQ